MKTKKRRWRDAAEAGAEQIFALSRLTIDERGERAEFVGDAAKAFASLLAWMFVEAKGINYVEWRIQATGESLKLPAASNGVDQTGLAVIEPLDATCPLCGGPDLGACACEPDAVNAALAERSAA